MISYPIRYEKYSLLTLLLHVNSKDIHVNGI